jgi:hypothetical protein
MNDDYSYYARRADEQRKWAAAASSPDARRRHLELAELYAARARALAPNAAA